ncbi:Hsp33 family molecular chaperone HslO [Kaarinaea lacus]
MQDRDFRQRFLFDQFPIRGELVHLNQSWHEILSRHDYPEPVRNLLGEMATAAVLLSATLKFNGALHLQIRGSGPVSLAVMEATSDRTIRGLAHYGEDVTDMEFAELVGDAILVVTIEHKVGERYQGIVDLSSGSLSLALENYMRQSQQIDTRLWLSAGSTQASGMILQKMPEFNDVRNQDRDLDAWPRITLLADTMQAKELSDLEFLNLLHRLFHEEDLRVFEKQPISFRCSCSRERVRDMLKMLGHAEVVDVLKTENHVNVNCEFCNHGYNFDSVDVEEIFAIEVPAKTSNTMH